MKKWLAAMGCVVLGLLFVLWFVGDDALDEGARDWLTYHHQHQGEPGKDFYLLLGLDAPPDQNPVEAGRNWYRQHQHKLEPDSLPMAWTVERPWVHERLRLPGTDELESLLDCRMPGEPGCDRVGRVLDAYAVVLERYKSWPGSGGMTRSAPDHWLVPPMQTLIKADLLARIELIDALMNADSAGAAELQAEAMERVRAYLLMSDSMLDLAMATQLFSDHVDLLVRLQAEGLLEDAERSQLFRDLENVSGSLERVMRGEFGLVAYTLEWLEERPDERVFGSAINRLILRFLYRKNMTLNASHDLYRWITSLDQPDDLSAVVAGNEPVWEKPVTLRNYASYIHPTLLPEASGFLTYVARLHDLQAKLALARAQVESPLTDIELRGLVRINPYGRGHGVELDESDGRLCLAGPLEDSRHIRCIPVEP